MRLALNNKCAIVTLKHYRFTHGHYLILCQMQADRTLCNCLVEIEDAPDKRSFVPVHALNLDDFMQASLLNLPAS